MDVTVTCRTDGCENNGVPITFEGWEPYVDETGREFPPAFVCGICRQPIAETKESTP